MSERKELYKLKNKWKSQNAGVLNGMDGFLRFIVKLTHKYCSRVVLENINQKILRRKKKGDGNKFTKEQSKLLNRKMNVINLQGIGRRFVETSSLTKTKIVKVDPGYTSKSCSECGEDGDRKWGIFTCLNTECGHKDHDDANASKNILHCGSVKVKQMHNEDWGHSESAEKVVEKIFRKQEERKVRVEKEKADKSAQTSSDPKKKGGRRKNKNKQKQ